MTVFQRAATLAAVTLSLAGLVGLSAPGQAAGLQATQAVATILPAPAAAPVVPLPVVAVDSDVTGGTATAAAEPAEFDTLDAAIAAQDVAAEADQAVRCLAAAIYFEAKGEPVDGQLAVAEVIINRAKSGRFPDDVCNVVKQRGQFSFVRAGTIPTIDAGRPSYHTAVAVARVAMAAAWRSTAAQALYFHARHEPMAGRVTRIAAIGNHVFYR